MLLAVDVGNTDIVYGVYHQGEWVYIWRIPVRIDKSFPYFVSDLRLNFLEAGLSMGRVDRVVYSSVVPSLNQVLVPLLRTVFYTEPVIAGPGVSAGLKIAIDFPYQIGSDLVANAVAAYDRYKANCIIVDFGTALTFTAVGEDGTLLGVAIVPGLQTAVKSLFANTAQLPEVPLVMPASVIGKNTVHSIQAGVLIGYEELVRGMVRRIRAGFEGCCVTLATGGLSSVIDTLEDEFAETDLFLTLDGLRIIGDFERKAAGRPHTGASPG